MKRTPWRLAPFAAAVLLVSACDLGTISNPADDFKLIIGLDPIETVAIGAITDAATGKPLTGNVHVAFSGDGAGSVIDFYSDPITERVGKGGTVSFGIANGVTPSTASPVAITVTATADGYAPTTRRLKLTQAGENAFTLALVSETRRMQGAEKAEASSTAGADGQTTTNVAVTTPATAGTQTTASAQVEAGTVLKDKSGAPLTGRLSTALTYYNAATRETQAAFPGGASVTTVSDAGEQDGTLNTIGYVSLRVQDGNGRRAASSDKPITVAMDVPQGAINPSTNQPFAPGDAVDVWGYDAETGRWARQGAATLTAAAGKNGGPLVLSWRSHEISPFMSFGSLSLECAAGTGASFTINPNGNKPPYDVSVTYGSGATAVSERTTINAATDGTTPFTVRVQDLISPVPDVQATVTFYGATGDVTLANVSACTGSHDVTLPAPDNVVDVAFDVSVTCPAGQGVYVQGPTGTLSWWRTDAEGAVARSRAISASTWRYDGDRLIGAALTISDLVAGGTYRFQGDGPQGSFTETITVTGATQTLSYAGGDACQASSNG